MVVDTSALMAIALNEAQAAECSLALARDVDLLISAGTLFEALIVARSQERLDEIQRILDTFPMQVVPVTEESARRAALAQARWGRGLHSAKLNFGDCFAYELAESRGCPLLYIGNDFSQTDIRSALDAEAPES